MRGRKRVSPHWLVRQGAQPVTSGDTISFYPTKLDRLAEHSVTVRRRWLCVLLLLAATLVFLSVDKNLVTRLLWWVRDHQTPPVLASNRNDARWARFASWPLSEKLNPDFALSDDVQRGLAWDDRGLSYGVLDACRVLFGHARPRDGMRLSFWTGTETIYRHVHTSFPVLQPQDSPAGPFIGQLDEVLPDSVKPLPVLEAIPPHFWLDMSVVVFVRGGLIGTQTVQAVGRDVSQPAQCFLKTSMPAGHPGLVKLNVGDSGGALVAVWHGTPLLLGSANSYLHFSKDDHSAAASEANTFYFLPFYVNRLRELGASLVTQ